MEEPALFNDAVADFLARVEAGRWPARDPRSIRQVSGSQHVKGSSAARGPTSMLSQEQNDLITRIGPGTAAGALMRRYWQPAALVDELSGTTPGQAGTAAGRKPGAVPRRAAAATA